MAKASLTHPEQTQHDAFWRIEIDGMSVGGQGDYPGGPQGAQFRESFVPNMPQ
jgi:hypothetical protein